MGWHPQLPFQPNLQDTNHMTQQQVKEQFKQACLHARSRNILVFIFDDVMYVLDRHVDRYIPAFKCRIRINGETE